MLREGLREEKQEKMNVKNNQEPVENKLSEVIKVIDMEEEYEARKLSKFFMIIRLLKYFFHSYDFFIFINKN